MSDCEWPAFLTPDTGLSAPEPSTTMMFSMVPPASPWGINFGGGLNSTAVMIECFNRGHRPDWIIFADTGDERPETYAHVERMREWCAFKDWPHLVSTRWVREDGTIEALSSYSLRTAHLPSAAYGNAGCTTKWKIQPMDRWRREQGFDHGAFAVGYDAGEKHRITKACKRGDQPDMTAWYPLVAWGIDRDGCQEICSTAGLGKSVAKSSCFMCPNMKPSEWRELRATHPHLHAVAMEIDRRAIEAGNFPRNHRAINVAELAEQDDAQETLSLDVGDRCHHGGCFT